ncbi:MAG TPA: metallophosphoesterase [Oscillospiraceae bacterium]|nr:metallophosphoesterase [Oscillospiraceae bacterium]
MHRRNRRRKRLWLLPVCLLLLSLFLWDGNTRLTVKEVSLSPAGLPAAFDGYRIVHLSDGHGFKNTARLLKKVAALEPDLIVYTGDLIDDESQLCAVPEFAAGLAAIAPTYYVTGNHEWAAGVARDLFAILKDNGVVSLRGTAVTLERGGETIVLAGIDDPNGLAGQTTLPELMDTIRQDYGDAFVLLLAHRNTDFPLYVSCGVPLTLAGHSHGGIVRLPFVGGLLSTDRTFFPAYDAGLFEEDGCWMFVSCGIGNVGKLFRIFNPPQIPVITLKKG